MEIRENEVYTLKETQALLKVSESTLTRMIKKKLIHAARVGRQYRIVGKEILRIVSPLLEDQVGKLYNKGRRWVHSGLDQSSKTHPEPSRVAPKTVSEVAAEEVGA